MRLFISTFIFLVLAWSNVKHESNFLNSKPIVGTETNVTTVKVALKSLHMKHVSVVYAPKIYGFVGVQVFKVTANKSELLKSFGNKNQYFFDKTEHKCFPNSGDVYFSFGSTPDYLREFQIPTQDWNNPNIRYEIRIWHHLKGKVTGPNLDFKKHSETLDLKATIKNHANKEVRVGKGFSNNSAIKNVSGSYVTLKINQ